ncbi:GAF domain-containing protein [Lentzea sp. HUAS12]|uniref:helix-turn-helix domain-containing protein n=1 Tax=Lentzea sp. HUAS12 TaxID=2951806 RepID=UPI0020A08DFF|nr:GAF domain-containing protein [Lentzea sp. HUAS12]USX56522.1 GAF domain-containing protein [Lentzea sp. HUAS12]
MTRRREAELAALFETASELAGMRELDAVLRSIVRRARTLLGTDVSYLSMNDPAGTYMRVTDGSFSPLFQKVRLGLGEGLGGLVAQTARPYATPDYFADARFNHTRPIDSAVRDEGLAAILGVPLKLDSKVIGVLYAADRTSREFPPEEVALLQSLADHAAIAIDTASLFATIQSHNEAMKRAEEAHDRLTDLVLRGGSSAEVAAAVGELLGGPVEVLETVPSLAVRANGRAVLLGDVWVCAVLAGSELLGGIALSGRPGLTDADRRVFERSAAVTALLLLLRRTVAEAENKVRGELITDILDGRDAAELLARGRRVGVELSDPHVVLVADGNLSGATHYASVHRGLAGSRGRDVVLALPSASTQVAREVAKALDATVGACGPVEGPAAIAEAYEEARRCLKALRQLGREKDAATMADLGFVGVLLGDRANVSGYVRSVLGPVLDYDAERGTELVHTLEVYFRCGANLSRAKAELHLHVNTVTQRLDRVTSLLGDWQSPDRVLEVQLALRLLRLQGP